MRHRISGAITTDAYWSGRYEHILDRVYLLYHQYPTNLQHHNLTDAQREEIAHYEAEARAQGRNLFAEAEAFHAKYPKRVYIPPESSVNGIPAGVVVSRREGSDAGCIFGILLAAAVWVGILYLVLK